MAPTSTRKWTLEGRNGFDSLRFHPNASIPPLCAREVLVRFHSASLNYRDLVIAKGTYTLPTVDHVVPASDGAGVVEAVGLGVIRFKPGDRVVTLFNQGQIAGSLENKAAAKSLGGTTDGTLREYGAYDEEGLVAMPTTLDFKQASTLPCAALTAWNALYGLQGNVVKAGHTVVTQGTGGVSIFALQFAKAAGARVIATTSSDAKARLLTHLGADHVINYNTEPNWGSAAAKLTPGRLGVNHVVEIGGAQTMAQSLKAVKVDGCISIIGFVGGGGPTTAQQQEPSFLECLSRGCVVRGVHVGSRMMFEEMNRAIDANGIKPVVDGGESFALDDVKRAYQYMASLKLLSFFNPSFLPSFLDLPHIYIYIYIRRADSLGAQWDRKHIGKVTISI